MNEVPIQPAATLIIIRESQHGPEVLLQQRNPQAIFAGGAWVFPGGRLDDEDSWPDWQQYCAGLTEQDANQRLGVEQLGLAFWVAAIREAFEESGLLYVNSHQPISSEQRQLWRQQLLANTTDWHTLVTTQQWQLQAPQMHYVSRWITPAGPPRRFDTRFFLALAPSDQEPSHDDHEAVDTRWFTPGQALAEYERGSLSLIFPTLMTLKAMSGQPDCATLIQRIVPV